MSKQYDSVMSFLRASPGGYADSVSDFLSDCEDSMETLSDYSQELRRFLEY